MIVDFRQVSVGKITRLQRNVSSIFQPVQRCGGLYGVTRVSILGVSPNTTIQPSLQHIIYFLARDDGGPVIYSLRPPAAP